MFTRALESTLRQALGRSPATLVTGARQTGKSTLVQAVSGPDRPYLTFDDPEPLAAATRDPRGFLAGLPPQVVLDEVQKAPGIFPALKLAIDRNRQPGRFLLTGSANVLLLPRVADSLAGRLEVLPLGPLTQGEIEGHREAPLDRWFEGELGRPRGVAREELIERVLGGGFPEPLQRKNPADRSAWFSSYLSTLLTRDVRDLADIDRTVDLQRILALAAVRSASLLNYAELASSSGLPQSSLKRYLGLLTTLYLMQTIPAWATTAAKSLARRPKLLLADSGLMAHLMSTNSARIEAAPALFGPLLKTFALNELTRQSAWSALRPRMLHFRDNAGHEVDAVLEDPAGRLLGIEVKAGQASIGPGDVRGLRAFAATAKKQFARGIVLYGGDKVVPFEANLHAVPISALWS